MVWRPPCKRPTSFICSSRASAENVIAVMQTEPVAVARSSPVYGAPPSGGVIIEERGPRTIAPTGTTIISPWHSRSPCGNAHLKVGIQRSVTYPR